MPTNDMNEWEEILCDDCKKPFRAEVNKENGRTTLLGCNCEDKAGFNYPRGCVVMSFTGGMLTVHKPKIQS
jgi:hypothetical protein